MVRGYWLETYQFLMFNRKKSEGVILGRPKGKSKPENFKLFGRDEVIVSLIQKGYSQTKIAKRLHVNRLTLGKYIKKNSLK